MIRKTKFITWDILKSSIIGACKKMNPRYMMKNPVLFVMEIGFAVMLLLCFFPDLFGHFENERSNLRLYNAIISVIFLLTVFFVNFVEAVAESRDKAQAQSLKKAQKDMQDRIRRAFYD